MGWFSDRNGVLGMIPWQCRSSHVGNGMGNAAPTKQRAMGWRFVCVKTVHFKIFYAFRINHQSSIRPNHKSVNETLNTHIRKYHPPTTNNNSPFARPPRLHSFDNERVTQSLVVWGEVGRDERKSWLLYFAKQFFIHSLVKMSDFLFTLSIHFPI